MISMAIRHYSSWPSPPLNEPFIYFYFTMDIVLSKHSLEKAEELSWHGFLYSESLAATCSTIGTSPNISFP
jgi:hypothetical protein